MGCTLFTFSVKDLAEFSGIDGVSGFCESMKEGTPSTFILNYALYGKAY